MKKTLVFFLLLAMLTTIVPSISFPMVANAEQGPNLFTSIKSTFEDPSVPEGWSAFCGGTLSTSTTVAHTGQRSLKLSGRTYSYTSPQYNIYSTIKAGGIGTYSISIWVYTDNLSLSPKNGRLLIRGTSADQYSFFLSGQSYGPLSSTIPTSIGLWTKYTGTLNVTSADLTEVTGDFYLMIDFLEAVANQNLYFDDVEICKLTDNLFGGTLGTFEEASVPVGWNAFGGGSLSVSSNIAHNGSNSLQLSGRTQSWHSPAYNIYSIMKTNGPGTYYVSFWLYVDSLSPSPSNGRILIRGASSADDNSFIDDYNGNYYGIINTGVSTSVSTWTKYTGVIEVLESDLTRETGTFNLVIDFLPSSANQNIYIDDVQLCKPSTSIECWRMHEFTFTSLYADVPYISGPERSFECATVPAGWSVFGGGTLSTSTTVAQSDSYSLKLSGRTQAYYSPQYNIYSILKNGGAGTYRISFWIYTDSLITSPSNGRVLIRGTSVDQYSFFSASKSYGVISNTISTPINTWTQYNGLITVTSDDLTNATGDMNLMIDFLLGTSTQNLYLDTFEITKTYDSPFDDITMDVTFCGPNNTTIVMPAFWDGGYTWKVRFAPTLVGQWTYTTSCSNTSDLGLHGLTGNIDCGAYTGNLAIYQHGFIKTSANNRYFTYADGTPFFYIGDTHWSLSFERYDGSNIAGIDSQFKYMVDYRVNQGFTVYQSQPGSKDNGYGDEDYSLLPPFSESVMAGFDNLDRKFQYIADQGLVHANSQLFFVGELVNYYNDYSNDYLDKLARYWVARYAAYPVLWTTAQEADNDFHYENGHQTVFTAQTNPWKIVTASMHDYDPYQHPLTAHQEITSTDPNVGTCATNSAFKYIDGHNWYAAQWKPTNDVGQLNFAGPIDLWNSDVTKPIINYEGRYDHYWTNEFGARMQGWTSFLNGMYGHGYGASGVWMTMNDFDSGDYAAASDLDQTTRDPLTGVIITLDEKRMNWYEGLQLPAATQLATYMKGFFTSMNWWQLTPRFNSTTWYSNNGAYYSVASNDNDVYVAYFYNTTTSTGTLKNMDSTSYTATWFNPRSGAYTAIGTITPSDGQWTIPNKPDSNDWVLYVHH